MGHFVIRPLGCDLGDSSSTTKTDKQLGVLFAAVHNVVQRPVSFLSQVMVDSLQKDLCLTACPVSLGLPVPEHEEKKYAQADGILQRNRFEYFQTRALGSTKFFICQPLGTVSFTTFSEAMVGLRRIMERLKLQVRPVE
jgi:hypothetical protein